MRIAHPLAIRLAEGVGFRTKPRSPVVHSARICYANSPRRASARGFSQHTHTQNKQGAPFGAPCLFGGGCGIRTHVTLLSNGFQEVYQRIPFQLSSVQFVLKRFAKILILQGFLGLFGTDMN